MTDMDRHTSKSHEPNQDLPRSENPVSQNSEILRAIVNSSPFPIAVTDLGDETILYWSQTAIDTFGHIPKTVSEWYELAYPDPDYREAVITRWKPFLERVAESNEAVNTGEYQISCKDGSTKVCELYAQFIPKYLIVTFNDVTEKKQTEEALRQSEEKHRMMFENAPICYQSLDKDGRFIDVNPCWLSTLGYDRDEIIGHSFSSFLHSDFTSNFEENFPKFKKRGHVNGVQFKIRHKDGSYRFIEITGCIGYFPDGSFRQTYCVFQDITERKKIETNYLRRNAEFEAIYHSITDAIVFVDLDRRIIMVNPTFETMLGYSADEAKGKTTDFFYEKPEEYSQSGKTRYHKDAEIESPVYEINYRRKDGTIFPSETLGVPVKTPNGEILGFLGVIRDISSRKEAERRVERVATELMLAQRIAKVGNWSFDPAVGVPEWSEEVFRIYERDPALGPVPLAEYKKLYSQEQFQTFYNAISAAIENGTPYTIELSLRVPSGTEKWIQAICEPLAEKGPAGHCLIGTIQDVTARKRTELELKRRSDYEQVLAKVSSVLAGLKIEDIDQAIDNALSMLGEFTESDRVYVFQFKNGLSQVDNTHEYCAKGIEPQIDDLKDMSLEDQFPWFNSCIKNGEQIYVPDVNEMPEEAQLEQEHFESQGIKSLFVTPIKTSDNLVGFLGIDSVRRQREWDDDDKSLLDYCSETLSHVIEWQRVETELRRREFIFSQTFEQSSTSTSFYGPDGTIIRVNKAFCAMFGVDEREILGAGYNLFGDPVTIDAGILPIIREVFEERKNRRWEINFDVSKAAVATGAHTSKTESIYLETFAFPVVNDRDELEFVVLKNYDITTRKKAEKDLIALERRNQALLDYSPACHKIVDLDFNLQYMNSSGFKMLKLEETDEYYGKPYPFGFFPEASRNRLMKKLKMVKETRKRVVFESTACDAEGHEVWLYHTLIPVPDDDGTLDYITVVSSDVTERKRSEEELRYAHETVQMNKALLDATGRMAKIGGWELDALTNELNWTEETYRIHDLALDSKPDVAKAIDFYHPEDRPIIGAAVREALEEARPFDVELRIISVKGRELVVRAMCTPILEDGKVVRLRGTFQDVTEKKNAEEALRESETNFRAVIETVPLAIYLSSGLDHLCEYINPTFENLFGYTMEDVPSAEHWYPLAYPDARYRKQVESEWKAKVNHAIDTQSHIEPMETVVTCKDGSQKDILWGFATIGEKNYAYGLDLTEQKRMQERLLHSDKMDAIGQLAGGVAHDFNNQLSGVLGYGAMLAERLDDPSLRRYAENICTAARRSADLTQKLLAFSHKGQFQYVPVEIHRTIQETVEMLHRSLDKRIEIRQDLHAQEATVDGDPSQLQNALLNLAINARDAMPAGGTLTFATELLKLDEASVLDQGFDGNAGRYIVISVTDTGSGIPDDILQHVFEPFFTTKGHGEGTGMGLASVYGTVRHHNGDVTIDSLVGQGTTFKVYLPLSVSVAVETVESQASPSPAKALRILVVDDEEMVRELGCDILTAAGHSVHSAVDGQEAVDLYREKWEDIDLVVLDMVMPRMSGHDAFREMKQINPRIKAILASGYSLNEESQAILAEGVLGFVPKPFGPSKLLDAIQDAASEEIST